jgi:predicted SprT family Zn-dependent metalloprotease
MILPTQEIYDDLQRAYHFLNEELFDGKLPPCMITLQREKDTPGYFSKDRWANTEGDQRHEISLNPSYFVMQPIEITLSWMAHNMTHMWQELHGSPGRTRYHNTEWGNLLEERGLMPSSTGLPGGKRKGDQMKHYIIDGGRFDLACKKLIDESFKLRWLDRFPNKIDLPEYMSAMAGMDLDVDPEHEGEIRLSHALNVEGGGESLKSLIEMDSNDSPEDPSSVPLPIGDAALGEAPSPAPKKKPQGPPPPPMKTFAPPTTADFERLGIEQPRDKKAGTPNRFKFTCPVCSTNAWAKPSALLCCGECPDKPAMAGVPA